MLVLAVVFIFLQTWRATVIPMLAVPVSIIGTFAGLYILGFSINTLTLFAMVLAIGIVVDDAIVVLENVERLMREEKMSALRGVDRGDARGLRRADRDRAGALLGVHPGRVPGRHRGPALQAVRGDGDRGGGDLGLHRAHAHAGALRAAAEGGRPRVEASSTRSTWASTRLTKFFLRASISRSRAALVSLIALRSCVIVGRGPPLLARARRASCPPRTRATSSARSSCPTRASLQRTQKTGAQLWDILSQGQRRRSTPSWCRAATSSAARNKTNAGTTFVLLKDWDDRKRTAQQVARGPEQAGPGLHRRHGDHVQPAGDPRPGHRRRLRVLRAVAHRGRHEEAGRRHPGPQRRRSRRIRSSRASTRSTARPCRSFTSR